MHTLFKENPGLSGFVKFGIICFIGLSIINLYFSIQVNKKMNGKLSETA